MLIPVGGVRPQPRPQPSNIAWFRIAHEQLHCGVREVAGCRHNGRIFEYHSATTQRATSDETPWCSSFVNWCMQHAGKRGVRSAVARLWLNCRGGFELREPRRGAIAILWRGSPSSLSGHVAFVERVTRSRINSLGSNQGDEFSISRYRMNRVLGYRWPR